ncbi:MAG: ChbG/HpnK family deacetylase [Nitrospirae bacterium]|nr:ChbG/HpnK family deacetylase [Nitrospirota bacterium]
MLKADRANKIKSFVSREDSASKKYPRVIINADDFGITDGVNKAISELACAGRLTSTSVMSNMPLCEEIAKLKDRIGVGIHLNLTTGRPAAKVSAVPSLANEAGEFFDLSTLLKRMRSGQIVQKDVESEFSAQIKRLIDMGIQPDHVNSHTSVLKYPLFMKIAKRVSAGYGIPAVRTFTPRKFDYMRLLSPKRAIISLYLPYQKFKWKQGGFNVSDRKDSLLQFGLKYSAAISYLKDVFTHLPEGVLEFVVHPGYCEGDSAPLGGYVDEREVELQALMSSEFKSFIEHSEARLIRFCDI